MMAGNAVSMGKWKDKAKAIVWQWYCGMEAGNVLTDVLFGRVNPSGKLPESMPYCMEDCGAVALGEYPGRPLTEEEKKHMNAHTTMTYHDGIYVGYRYYEKYNVPVQFCFGHGLSYTTFDYSDVVQIPLTRRAFTYYDVKEKAFVVEPGEYQIYIAKSLQDVQDTVTVTMK